MNWHATPANQAATLIAGEARCRVWRTAADTWAALSSVCGDATAAYNFPALPEAQAWCEAHLAERPPPRI